MPGLRSTTCPGCSWCSTLSLSITMAPKEGSQPPRAMISSVVIVSLSQGFSTPSMSRRYFGPSVACVAISFFSLELAGSTRCQRDQIRISAEMFSIRNLQPCPPLSGQETAVSRCIFAYYNLIERPSSAYTFDGGKMLREEDG